MSIYFPSLPATFIHIPKTGGNSFRHWIKNSPHTILDHNNHLTISEMQTQHINLGIIFTFVRNPYSRLVSIFHFEGQRSEKRYKMLCAIPNVEHHPNYLKFKNIIETDVRQIKIYKDGFTNWLLSENEYPIGWSKKYLQSHWFSNITPNLTIKIEEIDKEIIRLQNLFNFNNSFLHINTSIHEDYYQYYNSASKRRVKEICGEDFERFKYSY